MNSLKGNWLSRGARTLVKLVGTTAALGALLTTACSSNSSELAASDAVGSGGTTAVQTPASEPGTAADGTGAANFDVAASARAFMASHPVRPPRPLDFSTTDASAGQGGEDAGTSPAPAFVALNKVLDLPGLPSAPTPYPLSEDGKYYKVNLLHRNFFPPTASATFSNGVHQLGAAGPPLVFDGGDQPFNAVTDTPGDPNVVVTLLVDMGQYFLVGAVRPLYPPFLGGGYPFRQRIRLATKLGPNPDWRTPVEESPVPTTDTTLSFDGTPGRFLELTMIGNGCNLYELFVYPSAQTSPTPTSANGYDLTSLGSTSTVNDNYFPLGLHWPLSWPAGGFYPKPMSWGPTGDAVATVDLGGQYRLSRLQLNFFWSTPWVNGGRLEVGSTADAYATVADSGPGHDFFPWPHTLNFSSPVQPVRYIRATDYFIPGSGLSGQTLWAVHAFADPGQHVGYFPLSADGKYFSVNLLRRLTGDTQPTALVSYANGAVADQTPLAANPNNAIDGDDLDFVWRTATANVPDATATITVDLGQVQSLGAIRQIYGNYPPVSSSIRVASVSTGPWQTVVEAAPISTIDFTSSFAPTAARYIELTMKGTTPQYNFANLLDLQLYPGAAAVPAPSSGSHLNLTYLTGMVYTPNSNLVFAYGSPLHGFDGYAYVKNTSQGATGDGTLTLDLGQQFQISEVDLSFMYSQTWPAGGKLDVDDGSGGWITVFDSGHGTALGAAAGGMQKIAFAAHTARYVRLTGYFDPAAAQGALKGIEVFGDNTECVPNCATKACGDDLSDGCGTMCPGVCGGGQVGCTTDAQCQAGLVCRGHVAGSAAATVCVAETCLFSPQLLGCGYSGAPCGPSCTKSPICSSNDQCPSGYVCGLGNGHRYGVPGANVCELPGCSTTPQALGCGTISDECGLCECTAQCDNKHCGDADLSDGCGGQCPATCGVGGTSSLGCGSDFDCQPGSFCAIGQGPRLGFPAGSNVCLLKECTIPAAADCGTVLSLCGLCPTQANNCSGRECGSDPVSGMSCGECADGQICAATGRCTSFASTPPIILAHGLNIHPVVPPASPPAVGLGATPGSFTVTEQGSASYSIPIELPPGRHGVAPSLQISYTSSTGNGTLGVGWSLDGLSTISRCNKSYAQEGQASPVRLDANDAFCLDGQRLIEVEPGEFRTAVETFARIRRLDFAISHPGGLGDGDGLGGTPASASPQNNSYFEVLTKDGRRLLYGSESQSWGNQRSTSSGAFVRTWALNRVEDRNGNFIHIVYRQTTAHDLEPQVSTTELVTSTTELVPDSITYTGNGVVEGDREIKFEYSDSRPDKLLGYQTTGGSLARTLRLEHIKVLALGDLVRRYDLHYEVALNKASRLTSVQECDGPNSICKGATTFSYKTDQGFDAGTPFAPAVPEPQWGAPMAFTPFGIALSRGTYDELLTRSDNGTSSIVTPLPGGDSAAVAVVMWSNPVGWAVTIAIDLINLFGSSEEHQEWFVDIFNDFVNHTANPSSSGGEFINDGVCMPTVPSAPQVIHYLDGSEGVHYTCEGQAKTLFIDVDGDGVQDRLQCSVNGQQIEYYLARNHDHEVPTHVRTLPGPDGSVPAFKNFCVSERAWASSPNSATEPPFIAAFDVDGDGTSNLLVNDRTGFSGLFFDGPMPEWRRLSTDPVPIRLANYYVAFLDANGDGLRDVLALPISGSHEYPYPLLWTNTGTSFQVAIVNGVGSEVWAPDTTAYVVDYDKDGIDELIQAWSVPKPGCDPNEQVCEYVDGYTHCDPTSAALSCQNAQKAWEDEAKLPHNWSMRRFIGGNITWEEISGPVYPGALGDFDGDGNLDLVTRKPSATGFYFMHHGSGRLQNALETVTDGLGRRVDVHYDLKNPEGKPTYGNSDIGRDFTKCSWPNACASRVDRLLVSSFERKHSEVADVWQTDVDTRLSYGLQLGDSSGLGTLGFDMRHTTVRDAAGALLDESEVGYVVPLSSKEALTAGMPAIEAPYSRAVVGVPSYTTDTGVHAASDLTTFDDDHLETRTDYHWIERTSSKGRPFAVLQQSTKFVSTWSPTDMWVALKLSKTIEVFQVDDFGNTTDHAVATEDYDAEAIDSAPVPGSLSMQQVHHEFSPSPTDIDSWLISKTRFDEVTDHPRCAGAALSCPTEVRTRHADYEYYDSGEVRRITRAANESAATQITTYDRDSYGNVSGLTEQDAIGDIRTASTTFDTRGIYPISYTDGLGRTTDVRFDERFGKLTVSLDPNDIAETWSYDDFGVLRDHSGPGGEETTDYDLDQRLVDGLSARYVVTTQVVGGPGTTERFNSLGQIVTRESSGLKGATVVESFSYDSRNRLRAQSRPHLPDDTSQGSSHFFYDDQNQLLTEVHPDGIVLTHEHALVSLLKPELQPLVPSDSGAVSVVRNRDASLNATYEFLDRDGRPVAMVDANNRTTIYNYGAFDAVRQIAGPNGTLSYDYDNYGRMLSSSDAAVGGTTTVTYNGLDEVVSALDPANRPTGIYYDELGRTKRLENADGITTFTYDVGTNALGRLTQTVGPTGQQTDYTYEPKAGAKNRGLLATVTQSLLPPGVSSSTAPTQLTTAYHFDEFSRLEQVDYPGASGFAVKYGFDSAGNVISATDPANSANVYWQVSGVDQGYRLKGETLGNGVTTDRHYEPLSGHLDAITTKHGGAPVQQLRYEYANDNLTRRTNVTSGVSETFGYDALNRVKSTTYSDRPESEIITYDPVSYRISRKDPIGNYSYQAQGRDWIQSAGDTQYTPDVFGNVKTRSGPNVPGSTQEYVYTTYNLPSHVTLQSGAVQNVDLAYDADGARVVKRTDAETTYYAGDLYQVTTSASATAQRFMIYAGGRAVAAATQASSSAPLVVSYLHDDALGSVESITAGDASVVGGRHFDVFGDSRGAIANVAQEPYGYTGQEQDPELGLVNMHGRMYDPRLGQFMSPDPEIQSPYGQGLNRFAYVFNSPMNYIDPSGFSAEDWETGLGLGVPYTAGLAATLWSTGAFSGGAVAGGELAAAAVGSGIAAPSMGAIVEAAAPAVAAAGALGNTVAAAARQPVQQFKAQPAPTRSTARTSAARTDLPNSSVSPRRERPSARTPAEAKPTPNPVRDEWGPRPDVSHTPGAYEARTYAGPILSQPINTDQSAEMFEAGMHLIMILNPIGGPEEALLGKLGSKLAAKLAAREGSLFLRASRAGYRLHGNIPDKSLLRKTASEGLVELRELTRTSIATREAEMLRLGAKGGHAARLGEERGLLDAINEILRGRKVP